MRGIRLRSTVKSVIAIVCAACFLTMSLGSVSLAVAAETWETWPKKAAEPGIGPPPPPPGDASGAAKAGDAAGTKTATGVSSGTVGWILAGTAAVVAIAVVAGSGGSDSSSTCSQ